MNRIFVASAVIALAASAANAAPHFGGASVSQSASSSADSKPASIFSWAERLVIAKLKGDAAAPVARSKRPQTPAQPECEEAKKAEEAKQAEAKPGLQAGPEPMYLAF